MNTADANGMVFVKNFASLPAGAGLEFTTFAPGWSAVRKFNGYDLTKKFAEARWNFFHLAGGFSAIALGRDSENTLANAVRRLLRKRAVRRFNALQITTATSRSFLGIHYIRVTANSRHIQQSARLECPPVCSAQS